jgi:hypothetical protein
MLRARLNRLQARSVGPLVRALTRRHAALYLRFGGRRFGTYYRKPVLVLSTTGRRSGQQRATPVVYMPDGARRRSLARRADQLGAGPRAGVVAQSASQARGRGSDRRAALPGACTGR